MGLKTRLGSPFWLEAGRKVAQNESGIAAGGRGKRHQVAFFFSVLRTYQAPPASILEPCRSFCLEYSFSAPFSGLN